MTPQQFATATQKHFDPYRSNFAGYDPLLPLQVLGTFLTEQELIQLSGAPVGSTVTMADVEEKIEPPGYFDPPDRIEHVPRGLLLIVTNPNYVNGRNEVVLFNDNDEDQSIGVYIKLVRPHSRKVRSNVPKGFCALMIYSMLIGMWSLPNFSRSFSRMSLMAAGGRNWGKIDGTGERWTGYIVWPLYGFDSHLEPETVALLSNFPYYPENLSACTRVSHVLGCTVDDSKFWSVVGDGWYMDFNISPDSLSVKRLFDYAERLPDA